MLTVKEFWNWFGDSNGSYLSLDTLNEPEQERLLTEFQTQLNQYSDGLYFEIGGEPDDIRELIITAGGDKEYFSEVETLVNNAPEVPGWAFKAFKPAMPGHFVVNWESIKLDTKDIYFDPLKNGSSSKLGIRVFLNDFDPNREDDFCNALYTMLDTILGEKSFALDIDHVDIRKMSADVIVDDLIEIVKLPNYIKWHNEKYNL